MTWKEVTVIGKPGDALMLENAVEAWLVEG